MKIQQTIRENGTIRIQCVNELPSLTQQNFKNQCDINNIMKKYVNTGHITHLNNKQGSYVDTSSLPDYHQALQTVLDAQNSFFTLPSGVRKRFQNDPQELLTFLKDPSNKQEAIKLGLINDEQKPKINDDKPAQTNPS